VGAIENQSTIYDGQITDLDLTKEEVQQRKEEKKLQRKLEKEQRKSNN